MQTPLVVAAVASAEEVEALCYGASHEDFQNDDMPATGPRSLRASAISFGMIVTRFA